MTDNANDQRSEELRDETRHSGADSAPEQGNEDRPSDKTDEAKAKDCREDLDCGDRPCMPKPTFTTFIMSLASSALVHLGEVPDPSTGEHKEDLAIAKHTIDMLCMLQEKITNGLDQDESRLLDGLLYELRMKFVVKK